MPDIHIYEPYRVSAKKKEVDFLILILHPKLDYVDTFQMWQLKSDIKEKSPKLVS